MPENLSSFRMFIANCTGNAKNSAYDKPVTIASVEDLASACRNDHVCVEFSRNHRSNDDYIRGYAFAADCDNDFTDDPSEWITPATVAEALPGVAFYAVKSRNCDKVKHAGEPNERSARPRYHYYFVLRVPIEGFDAARKLADMFLAKFPMFDDDGTKPAQFFYGHAEPVAEYHPGEIDITEYFQENPIDLEPEPATDISPERHPTVTYSDNFASLNVDDMLARISANCDYGTWYKVGMAIKAAGLEFEIWDKWSHTAPDLYPGVVPMRKKWLSFKGGNITFGTLVYMAEQNGWRSDPEKLTGEYKVNHEKRLEREEIRRERAAAALASVGTSTTADESDGDTDNPQETIKLTNDISSFVEVINKHFPIRYNELKQRGEIFIQGHWHDISDSDEAIITQFCQDVYGITNRSNLRDAVLICQRINTVNPLVEQLCSLAWDGTQRTRFFLRDILKCEDSSITQEISQMIFTGGIRRAFEPGCKWDNVPIFVGKQGSGKTTMVDLLGLGYSQLLRTFSGDKAIEGIGGIWIGEIGELSAVKKAKDIEEIKSFISARADKYRPPYARHDIIIPRRCIFIGTTNSNSFLSDNTGNRRFFPVVVHSDAREIWGNYDQTKEYVCQAWAEALQMYRDGTLPADYDHSIDNDLNKTREDYKADDWRISAIQEFLGRKDVGEYVCCLELWRDACGLEKEKMTMLDSRIIGEHMDNHPEWERLPGNKKHRFGSFGQQRGWKKISSNGQ